MAAKVRFYADGSDFQLRNKARIKEWLRQCVEEEDFKLYSVNFIFCSQGRHLEINRQFLGHDWATDVITFDYSEGLVVSGDIFIDPVTVAENAENLCIAPAVEMRRVMVHGVLHLCGHNDKTSRERRAMRALEDHYLRKYYASV